MRKEELKISIVEDDRALSAALQAAISKAGYSVQTFSKPDEVVSSTKLSFPDVFLIDCLLPRTSGVSLAEQLQKSGAKSHFIFMSGIYRDKSFIKDTLQRTKSKVFLTKPFEVSDLIAEIDKLVEDLVFDETLQAPFFDVLTRHTLSSAEKIEAIDKTSSIHGFEIPRVLSLVCLKGTSGVVTLVNPEKKSARIHIHDGNITRVEMELPNSLFGALLVERNLITANTLELLIKDKSAKPIGQRLVEANLLSPHVIQLINTEQTGVRLSQLISDTSYVMTWSLKGHSTGDVSISNQRLTLLFSDWIYSKIKPQWLKTFYLPWMSHLLVKSSPYSEKSPLWSLPPLSLIPELTKKLDSGISLQELIGDKRYSEEESIGAVHLLVLGGMICFGNKSGRADQSIPVERLKRVFEDMKNRNHFEVLGVSTSSHPNDIRKAYHDLAKTFHPDKLSANSPQDMVDLAKLIFARVNEAYDVLRETDHRENYLKELEHGQAEKIILGEQFLDEGIKFLKSGKAAKAIERLQQARNLGIQTAEINLLTLWARLITFKGLEARSAQKDKNLSEIEIAINKIPPEDRHSALYFYVKGLYYKLADEPEQAINRFKQALYLNPSFTEAQKELKVMQHAKKSITTDLLHADLKDVVGMLFKRRK